MEGGPKIFISYRRADSAGHTGRLYDQLSEHFGAANIFMDVETIDAGVDFLTAIEEAVSSCDVLLAVIGRHWFVAQDTTGETARPSHDYVGLEITAALRRDIRVIPVMVQGAAMPHATELPDELAGLTRRNAMELSDRRWREDVERLIAAIERATGVPSAPRMVLPKDSAHPPRWSPRALREPKAVLGLVAVLGLAVALLLVLDLPRRGGSARSASSEVAVSDTGTTTLDSDPGGERELTLSEWGARRRMGQTILQAQRALALLNYYSGPMDGIWGPRMMMALQRFQQDHGLTATTEVDVETYLALARVLRDEHANVPEAQAILRDMLPTGRD